MFRDNYPMIANQFDELAVRSRVLNPSRAPGVDDWMCAEDDEYWGNPEYGFPDTLDYPDSFTGLPAAFDDLPDDELPF